MQYRRYGKNGPEVSVLGFGVMRLPTRKRGKDRTVNFTQSVAILRQAMANGVNFFDSHHRYHNGLSEEAIGRALKGWKGRQIYVQTKTPIYSGEKLDDYKRLLEEALEKLQIERIDYLLSHSLSMDMFQKRGKIFFRLTDWALKNGYIAHRGFSSHESPENIQAFADTGQFDCMLVSYNWMNPQLEEVIWHAHEKGMGVAIMNPVGGGNLAVAAKQIVQLLPGARSSPEVALRYVLATPGVSVALSGMSTAQQVADNISIAARKNPMTPKQWQAMKAKIAKIWRQARKFCSGCGYCMPCPHGVDIPQNFLLLNHARFFGLWEDSRRGFQQLQKTEEGDASAKACKHCGKCLPKCPNHLAIIKQLQTVADELD